MPSAPNWKAILEFGSSIAEPRRKQARAFVAGLVDAGQLGREQAGAAVEDVLEIGRKRTEELSTLVRREVERQLRALGINKGAATPAAKPVAAKAPAKKAPAKKAAVTKAAGKKAAGKKAPAKKAAVKKVPAKKAVAAKAPAQKAAPKKAK